MNTKSKSKGDDSAQASVASYQEGKERRNVRSQIYPFWLDENKSYPRILRIQDRSKDKTENPNPGILGESVPLIGFTGRFFKHDDDGDLQFILRPGDPPAFIKENKGMPDYLRSAIKALAYTLEPILDDDKRMQRINEQDLKNLLTYLGIHRLWERPDIRQWIELREWIDTKGQDSPHEEALKDLRDHVLNLDSYQVPTDSRPTRALQFATREQLKARVHKLGSLLGLSYPLKITPWALMYGMSLQNLEDDHKSVQKVKSHCIDFLTRVRSRMENAKARMRELGVEIEEVDVEA